MPKHESQDWYWKPHDWVAAQEGIHTVPLSRMYKTSMWAFGPFDIKEVKKRPDGNTARMMFGTLLYTLYMLTSWSKCWPRASDLMNIFESDVAVAVVMTCDE